MTVPVRAINGAPFPHCRDKKHPRIIGACGQTHRGAVHQGLNVPVNQYQLFRQIVPQLAGAEELSHSFEISYPFSLPPSHLFFVFFHFALFHRLACWRIPVSWWAWAQKNPRILKTMKGRQLDRDRLLKNWVRLMSLTGFCFLNLRVCQHWGRRDQTVLATHFTPKNTKCFANVGCFRGVSSLYVKLS